MVNLGVTQQTIDHCLSGANYLGGLGCVVLSYFDKYAAAIGAIVVVLTFLAQQYHNYRMRKQGKTQNDILRENKDERD